MHTDDLKSSRLTWHITTEPAGLVPIALFFFLHARININSLLFLDEAKLANELLIRFGLGDRTKTVFSCRNDVATRYFDKHVHVVCMYVCMYAWMYVCTSSDIVSFSFFLFSTLCMSLIGRFVIILERTNCASRRLCTLVNVVKEHNSVNAENKHECFVI